MAYKKLFVTMGVSFIVMYTVMFLNVDAIDHIYISLTRTYMALLMVLPMIIIMLISMGEMYKNKKANAAIISTSLLLFAIVLLALRSQTLIGDNNYIKAMIPHHSSAIMTSKSANITDPELKQLSEKIIKSQQEEIAQMKAILSRNKK